MLRVMHLLHSMHVAGAEKLVYDIIPLVRGRVCSSVCCLDSVGDLGEKLRAQGTAVCLVGRRPGTDLGVPWRIARELRRHRVDVLHCHQYTPYFYGSLARLLYPRVKVVFTEHGRHVPDRVRPKRAVCNQVLQFITDAFTAVSGAVRQHLIRFEKMPGRRIRVIYNGVHPDDFAADRGPDRVRRQLGLPGDAPVVGTAARLAPVKDQRTLLRAFARVCRSMPQARLLIAGDGPCRQDLEGLARQLELDGSACFLGRRDDVPDLMQVFDVFVLSSLSEGTSVTLLEAMASGTACVATAVGGNPEVVVDGQTGLLSPSRRPVELADNLIALLRDPALRQRMGARGRERVYQRFTYAQMVYGFLEIYARLYPRRLKLGARDDELRRLQR